MVHVLLGKSLSFCCCLVTNSYSTLCNPMDCSTPGFPVPHYLPEFAQVCVHWVGDATQPSHPLLSSCPFAFPSIRVFSNKSVLCIRWPKYWSFSFSISPSNEYSGLISFRTDWFDNLSINKRIKFQKEIRIKSTNKKEWLLASKSLLCLKNKFKTNFKRLGLDAALY